MIVDTAGKSLLCKMEHQRAHYLRRFTAEHINRLCEINHIDLNEVRTKQDRITCLCELPHMMEDIPPEPKPAVGVLELLQVIKEMEVNRKAETDHLCKSLVSAVTEASKTPPIVNVGPKLPDFHKLGPEDDIVCWLDTFERLARAEKKEKKDWPRLLEPYLTGKAQKAFHSLNEAEKGDYDKIVQAVHRRYSLTPEAYRQKFKSDSKKAGETFEEYAHRLEFNFTKWLQVSRENKDQPEVKRIMNLVMLDQFLSPASMLDDTLRLKMREKPQTSLIEVAKAADEYVLRRRGSAATSSHSRPDSKPAHVETSKSVGTSRDHPPQSTVYQSGTLKVKPDFSVAATGRGQPDTYVPKRKPFNLVCYRCQQIGHREADCPLPSSRPQKPKPPSPSGDNTHSAPRSPPPDKVPQPRPPKEVHLLQTQATSAEVSSDSVGVCMGPYVEVTTGDKHFPALVDTGSIVSLITRDMCSSLEIDPSSSQSLITVNDVEIDTLGTVALNISVGGADLTIRPHCISQLPCPILLGMDFIQDAGLTLDFSDGSYWCASGDGCCIKYPLHGFSPKPLGEAPVDEPLPQTSENPEASSAAKLNSCILTNADKRRLDGVLASFPDVVCGDIGCTSLAYHRIDVGDAKPVRSPPYRLSTDREQVLQEQLSELLASGKVEPSTSPWASPVIMTPKKTGGFRMCVDYRKLNSVTTVDAYPMPTIDAILSSLQGAQVFSSLDLRSGYWQMMVHPDDVEKTAFICQGGLYQFRVLPFGVINGPASFQRLMSAVLGDLIGRTCYVYLDDIVCFSPSVDQHLSDLRDVLTKLQQAGLTVNLDKCHFGCREMVYLGHVITPDGVKPDPDKVDSIKSYPVPSNVKQLERFLGMIAWFHKFIPNFSTIAEPLHNLRRKTTAWKWSEGCQEAFDALKRLLTTEPVLCYPDTTQPFTVHTDASDVGLGAVLQQGQGSDVRTIAYASRALNSAERNYSTTERECLAVVWAMEKWRPYLEGKKCRVFTDHQALCWLFRKSKQTPRLARWVLRLQDFKFDVVYRPGALNNVPDALSRLPELSTVVGVLQAPRGTGAGAAQLAGVPILPDLQPDEATVLKDPGPDMCAAPKCHQPQTDVIDWIFCDDCQKWFHQTCVNIQPRQAAQMHRYSCPACRKRHWTDQKESKWAKQSNDALPGQLNHQQLADEQRRDPVLLPIIQYLTNGALPEKMKDAECVTKRARAYRLHGDILLHYAVSSWSVVVPTALRRSVLFECHSAPSAGHLGRTKTLARIRRQNLWWDGITKDVRSFVRACAVCRKTKPHFRKPAGMMLSTNTNEPWEMVAVDLMGPLPKSYAGHEYVLVAVDHYTKWTEVFPLKAATGKVIACTIARQLFSRYGAPKVLLSDNGSQFTSKALQSICAHWGVQQLFITPYHPQTNWVERVNRNLKSMMRAYVEDDHRTWDIHIAEFAFALNTAKHETTGVEPSMLMLKRQIRTPLTNRLPPPLDTPLPTDVTVAADATRQQAQERRRKYYNQRRRPADISAGDHVMLQTHPQSDARKHFCAKLAPLWKGPYIVKENLTPVNLKLMDPQHPDKDILAHVDQVKPCSP